MKIHPHHLERIHAMRELGASWKLIYYTLKIGCDIQYLQKRYHKWRNNKGFGFPPAKHLRNLPVAEAMEFPIKNFSEVVNFFFSRTNIELMEIPSPPLLQGTFI